MNKILKICIVVILSVYVNYFLSKRIGYSKINNIGYLSLKNDSMYCFEEIQVLNRDSTLFKLKDESIFLLPTFFETDSCPYKYRSHSNNGKDYCSNTMDSTGAPIALYMEKECYKKNGNFMSGKYGGIYLRNFKNK